MIWKENLRTYQGTWHHYLKNWIFFSKNSVNKLFLKDFFVNLHVKIRNILKSVNVNEMKVFIFFMTLLRKGLLHLVVLEKLVYLLLIEEKVLLLLYYKKLFQ